VHGHKAAAREEVETQSGALSARTGNEFWTRPQGRMNKWDEQVGESALMTPKSARRRDGQFVIRPG